ncbi:2'-5' RNA ligase family protein [Chengkuizengella axinellae]|uniref:Putative phosphoesterase Q5Y73_03640 n=1 Tax=Chengkuizengella axinellae TaxID=3064388 RepID=A0ABT9IV07_9BACL|nr:2'-5' RNA ligase family protein [Chengkuizengella sp. 2205SS18-9]MDP5273188.1 2'-5' RNA ligase family protein [Chengkuizengella sp. 2205SS18-9]
MNYGIVVFPSKEIQDFANNHRKRYDPHYKLIPPHITIKKIESNDENQLDEIVTLLEDVTSSLSPFEITFNRVSNFFPLNNVIYLALEDTEPMTNLYEEMNKGMIKEEQPRYPFTPHLTIGQNLMEDELFDIFANLKSQNIQYRMKVDRIHLLYQLENEVWTAYQSFVLPKEK